MEFPYNHQDVDTWKYQDVPGDLVFWHGKSTVSAVWLAGGARASQELSAEVADAMVLPSATPGKLLVMAGLGEAGRSCRKVVPGGDKVLLICAEGVDPLHPGTKVRIRSWSEKAP